MSPPSPARSSRPGTRPRPPQSSRIKRGVVVGLVAGLAWVGLDQQRGAASAADGVAGAPTPEAAAIEGATAPTVAPLRPSAMAIGGAFAQTSPGAARASRWAIPAAAIDPLKATVLDGGLGQVLPDGTKVHFTLDARLQRVAQSTLERYKVGWGAVVAIRPKTGEILAMAEYADGRPDLSRLSLYAGSPAASVFKIITSATLLEYGGMAPKDTICTHGGHHKLTLYNLKPSERLDTKCETFGQAFGSSNNVAFARWADQKLEPAQLQDMSKRFLFGRRIPFPWAVGVSEARVPVGSRLGFARTAAGFEGTTLSPLHAALLVAAVANRGQMMAPILVKSAEKDGNSLFVAEPAALQQVLSPERATALLGLMEDTITYGTGRKFFEKGGKPRLPVRAGGKSGSLAGKDEGGTRNYSWFVAVAPIEDPEIVVASLVVNGETWTIKGAVPAREVLAAFFDKAKTGVEVDKADRDPLSDE
ncbi:MAG: penicillin-binding protein [Deltaproteobacteria bacterium]|nr:penicillin-binding protein [Deltaproteobacteria bacterium]